VKPLLALSTSWCSHRHTDGYAMLQEMAALGFEHVELSHGIRILLLPGILQAVEEGVVKISSTHNFCPLPAGVLKAAPNLFEPSNSDPREHQQWLRQTKRSLDFARQVKARALVCHLGSVTFFWLNPGARLRTYQEKHPELMAAEDKRYQAKLAKALAKIRRRMPPYWARTQASVREVLGYASTQGVLLGLENREKLEELPLDADYPGFLASLPAGAPAGYWHDTGHAQLKQNMGVIDHREQLEKNASRLIGFHLHDVNAEGDDHQAVGSGKIDFKMVSTFWRPEHLLTLELGPRTTVDEVRSSKERLEALIG
jgi:sugar phosphate isomerase/epimerase